MTRLPRGAVWRCLFTIHEKLLFVYNLSCWSCLQSTLVIISINYENTVQLKQPWSSRHALNFPCSLSVTREHEEGNPPQPVLITVLELNVKPEERRRDPNPFIFFSLSVEILLSSASSSWELHPEDAAAAAVVMHTGLDLDSHPLTRLHNPFLRIVNDSGRFPGSKA